MVKAMLYDRYKCADTALQLLRAAAEAKDSAQADIMRQAADIITAQDERIAMLEHALTERFEN